MNKIERKRIAVEIPTKIHKQVENYCKPRGLHMTQWIISLIIKELESKK